jgi:hypothetical protein
MNGYYAAQASDKKCPIQSAIVSILTNGSWRKPMVQLLAVLPPQGAAPSGTVFANVNHAASLCR